MSSSSTVLRISFALALLSATMILLAYTLGFMPDEEKAERDARASIAESLAVQVISQTGRNDLNAIQQTIDAVVSRNKSIQSIALRKSNGIIVAQAGDHKKYWVPVSNGVSTETHIYVPINNGATVWGALEMSFLPLQHGLTVLGIPIVIAVLAGFLGIVGLAGNYYVLRRSLRELDPSRVVPDRVQKAFDTLAEGILILDDRGLILLSNSSFASEVNEEAKLLVGTQAADLPWHQRNTTNSEFPWIAALRDAAPVVGASLAMKTHSGEVRQYTVNATRISDDKGIVTGVIVTFDDITELELKNNELNQLVTQLKEKEVEVNLKNRELHHLATRDPLTNCLNRRAFFDAFQRGIEHALKNNTPVYCMMMDLDHFKNVNDQYGHAVGDEVIVLMGDILKSACRETDLAGRYGGEEFCLALFGLTEEHCFQVAERIRLAVTARAKDIKILERSITTSIGIVKMAGGAFDPNELLARADKALYAAKTSGRNRIVDWKDLSEGGTLSETAAQISAATQATVSSPS
ncbi:MAG TPA: diguanylate cyclase, partial [Rhizobiales bacterium]|nr:diguanylate cyclase [Hyphomicrobiales bacterium]